MERKVSAKGRVAKKGKGKRTPETKEKGDHFEPHPTLAPESQAGHDHISSIGIQGPTNPATRLSRRKSTRYLKASDLLR